MKSDIEIAQSVMPLPVVKIAQKLNVSDDDLQQYGKFKAKLPLSLIDEDKVKRCKLILVSAISP
ncbi:MAG: formate--tetrahydrofolate ligase, partial [Saprospiraceae bacterium]